MAPRKSFKKFTFRGVDLEDLVSAEFTNEQFLGLVQSRQRRSLKKGFNAQQEKLLKKLRSAKLAAGEGVKPATVKTHLRNMIVVPEMIGSVVAVYTGKQYIPVEVRADMLGHYLGEFAMTYKRVKHSGAGHGATRGSRAVALK